MAGTAHKMGAVDAPEKKSREMAGCKEADLDRGKAKGLSGNGIKRTQRADPHLNKQCGEQERG